MPIPKIIIQTHRHRDIGVTEKQTWVKHHPDYQHLFFNNADCLEFFRTKMPQLLETYNKLPLPVQKADLFRYAAIYYYGGIYADVDTVCMAPVESYIDMNANNLVVGIEMTPMIYSGTTHEYTQHYCSPTQLLQWVFAAPAKHPALAKLLNKICFQTAILPLPDFIHCSKNARFTLELTGPMCFTNVIHDFLSEPGKNTPEKSGVTILPQLAWGFNPWQNPDTPSNRQAIKVLHLYHGSWKANPVNNTHKDTPLKP